MLADVQGRLPQLQFESFFCEDLKGRPFLTAKEKISSVQLSTEAWNNTMRSQQLRSKRSRPNSSPNSNAVVAATSFKRLGYLEQVAPRGPRVPSMMLCCPPKLFSHRSARTFEYLGDPSKTRAPHVGDLSQTQTLDCGPRHATRWHHSVYRRQKQASKNPARNSIALWHLMDDPT